MKKTTVTTRERYKVGDAVIAVGRMVGIPRGVPVGTAGKVTAYKPPIGARPALIDVQFEGFENATVCWPEDITPGA